jgi:chemotaxis signal transduction protein
MLLRLGTRWFGLDVQSIEEVALRGDVTRVPTAPSHILGVTTLRGRLVTVVGLEQMIGGAGLLSRENSATLPRLVVVRDGEYEMAVVAEGIQGMTEYVPSTEPDKPRPSSEFVREEFDWHGNHVSLLDTPRLIAAAARLAGILSPSEEMEL